MSAQWNRGAQRASSGALDPQASNGGAIGPSPSPAPRPPHEKAFRRVLVIGLELLVAIAIINPQAAVSPGSLTPDQADAAANPVLVSRAALASLPTSGAAWQQVLSWANASPGTPKIADQDDDTELHALAKALVYARTGDTADRTGAISIIKAAVGTESGGRTLALGRNLPAYVIAADLVGLSTVDPAYDSNTFRPWLRSLLTKNLDGLTLVETHEKRPNNWGTHAGAARVAIAAYLDDNTELARAATVFRGWLGDRSAYAGFSFGSTEWQCDPSAPVAVDAQGCSRSGIALDGALPDEMRRGGGLKWPPSSTDYPWEALQGAMLQASLLSAAGYDVWSWSDNALLRAVKFLYDRADWPATHDDEWQTWLIDAHYGTKYRVPAPARLGKNFGFTDWLFSALGSSGGSSSSGGSTSGGSTSGGSTSGGSGGSTGSSSGGSSSGSSGSSSGGSTSTKTTAPVVAAPVVTLARTTSVSTTTVPITVTWKATAAGAGIASYALVEQVDGGAWTAVKTSSAAATSVSLTLSNVHTYRFRVRLQDKAARWSSWAAGTAFAASQLQESSATYSGTWTNISYASYLGEKAKSTNGKASASLTFTGSAIEWIGPKGPTRGTATVYLDGTKVATVDMHATAFSARNVLLNLTTKQGTHVLKIVGSATSGHPTVAIDAFFVLRAM